jgi:hypothetical protein
MAIVTSLADLNLDLSHAVRGFAGSRLLRGEQGGPLVDHVEFTYVPDADLDAVLVTAAVARLRRNDSTVGVSGTVTSAAGPQDNGAASVRNGDGDRAVTATNVGAVRRFRAGHAYSLRAATLNHLGDAIDVVALLFQV